METSSRSTAETGSSPAWLTVLAHREAADFTCVFGGLSSWESKNAADFADNADQTGDEITAFFSSIAAGAF